MTSTHISDAHVSQLNPPEIRDALRYAAAARDHDLIDELTDRLVARGLVRPRSDSSRFVSISAMERNPHPGAPS